jgi:hypothetical protein
VVAWEQPPIDGYWILTAGAEVHLVAGFTYMEMTQLLMMRRFRLLLLLVWLWRLVI